tara:strand:+ start:9617 stop:9784 length:168 start_codon:yes stop_codon:yes gene_type:complete
MLAKEEIAEFKQIYEDTYGVELDDDTVTEIAHRVVGLYDAILKDYECKNPQFKLQ